MISESEASVGDDVDKVLDLLQAALKANGKKLSDAGYDVVKGGLGTGVGGTTLGSLVVSSASDSARNGSFAPDTVAQASGTDTDINGQTNDGKFELDVVLASNGSIKRAAIWYFGSGNTINFFGCNAGSIPCTGVGY